MEIAERFGDRVTDLTVTNIEHLASAGIGVAIAWIGARRRSLVGAALAVSGVALAVRSITRLYRAVRAPYADFELHESTEADDVANIQRIRDSSPQLYGNPEMQGEGDRRAARSYNDHLRAFIEDGRVEEAAEEAASDLDDTRRWGLH